MADESTSLGPKDLGPPSEDSPSVQDLEQLLNTGSPSCHHADEVWPNLFLGDHHILNAAHGTLFCQESHDFYGTTIEYRGVPAHDLPSFDLSLYFYCSAEFIHKALTTPGGKIFVHCAFGISRSSSLVLAYLMIYHHFSLVKAIQTVKEHRWIFPNRGFLKQLRNLDLQLRNKTNK
ncbi:hypothetical protein E2320_008213 [Naja naja]|nr:hypothetical protein E2320_008213 [Naja naja]